MEKERERNTNVWLPLVCPLPGTLPATQSCDLTGNRTSNPLLHRSALNPLSYTSQGSMKILKGNVLVGKARQMKESRVKFK